MESLYQQTIRQVWTISTRIKRCSLADQGGDASLSLWSVMLWMALWGSQVSEYQRLLVSFSPL